MKGGTTVLYDFICKHPNVVPVSQKEVHYFSLHYSNGEHWYREHFKQKKLDSIIGEASPTYFDMATTPVIPRSIKNDFPDIKIILIVRDPVERALSHFNHFCKINNVKKLQEMGPERFFNQSFENAVRETTHVDTMLYHVLNFSCYNSKHRIYKSIFGKNILVLRNDQLRNMPRQTMQRVQEFLGLSVHQSDYFNQITFTNGTSLDQISKKTRKKLTDFLYVDYEKFCTAANLNFSD